LAGHSGAGLPQNRQMAFSAAFLFGRLLRHLQILLWFLFFVF
jgi:hypothetical protein